MRNRFRYGPEDVDCKLCTNYQGKRKSCAVCPWLAERIEAGVVGYREAVTGSLPDWFGKKDLEQLKPRLETAIASFPGSLFPDAAHKKRMEDTKIHVGLRKKRDTPAHFAAMFLLTYSEDLCRRSMNCYGRNGIDFWRVELQGISPEDYTLLSAARDIYSGNFRMEISDLTDEEVIGNGTFTLILNALLIARYGSDALAIHERRNLTPYS